MLQDKTLFRLVDQYAPHGIYICEDINIKKNFHLLPYQTQNVLNYIHNQASCSVFLIEAVEEKKTISTVITLWDFLLRSHASRNSLLISIGGGITSDMAAFAASTFHRGMPLILIPTTLLSMIDASIGGKTGLNRAELKNQIGTFYPPIATFWNTGFLTTLSNPQILSGFAEIFKTALLDNEQNFYEAASLLQKIENSAADRTDIFENMLPFLQHIIAIKKKYVKKDRYDKSIRHALNFGHTIGHAIEEYYLLNNTPPLLHGYAVMYGLIVELYICNATYHLNNKYLNTLVSITKNYFGVPKGNCKTTQQIIDLLKKDKKIPQENIAKEGCTGFSLLRDVGFPQINQFVSYGLIEEALEFLWSM